jgi:hypothetical protein
MDNSKIDQLITILESMKTTDKKKSKGDIISKIDNSDSKDDVSKFKLDDLKKYCQHYKIEVDGLKSKYVKAVWEYIEDQYEWYSDEETDSETDSDESDEE